MSNEPEDRERVWQVVALIPAGQVSTYGDVAGMAGLARGARKVGRILAHLPEGSQLPWHRVVNASGRISLPIDSPGHREQRRRLEAEGVTFFKGRLSLARYRWDP